MNKYVKKGYWKYILLALIILLSSILRLYKIDSIPGSLYWDEAAIGYNAYSISQTLGDEYGNFLPLLFKSFDDYKMPLYVYSTVIPVKLIGLSELSIRLPSAFFGISTVLAAYFLTLELFKKVKNKNVADNTTILALLVSFFMSISPWHIQFSRAAFEASAALFFVVLGMTLFLKGLRNFYLFGFAFLSFTLSLYSYRSALLFLPLLIAGIVFLHRKEIIRFGVKKVILTLVIFSFLAFPIYKSVFSEGNTRTKQTSIANEVNELGLKNFQRGEPTDRKLLYLYVFSKNYILNFSPDFLFLSGDPNIRHSPNVGMLYAWEAPFLLIGLYYLLRKIGLKTAGIIAIWLIAAILPAALTIPSPHALRTLNILPIPQILTSLGIVFSISFLPRLKKVFAFAITIIIFSFLVRYIYLYYDAYNAKLLYAWGDGYKQLFLSLDRRSEYENIVVTGYFWQPYIYALFYSKYDPFLYQKNGDAGGFGNYIFGGTGWDNDVNRPEITEMDLSKFTNGNTLFVLAADEYKKMTGRFDKLGEIKNKAGETVFVTATLYEN